MCDIMTRTMTLSSGQIEVLGDAVNFPQHSHNLSNWQVEMKDHAAAAIWFCTVVGVCDVQIA